MTLIYTPNAYRGENAFNVHRSRSIDGKVIFQSFDYVEGDGGSQNAAFQHRVEDNIGELTGNNDLAVMEGERARQSRETGFATLDAAVRNSIHNGIAANIPRFQMIEDMDGNILGTFRYVTNLRTGFTEIHLNEILPDGDVRHYNYEITRRV